jgi:hypothetical protein
MWIEHFALYITGGLADMVAAGIIFSFGTSPDFSFG